MSRRTPHPRFPQVLREVRQALAALGCDVSAIPVREGELDVGIGHCEWDSRDRAFIIVKRGLVGSRRWRVLLHEFGHALGLEHTRTGIMAPKSYSRADFSRVEPTELQKRRWTLEIARQVLEKRYKVWTEAA